MATSSGAAITKKKGKKASKVRHGTNDSAVDQGSVALTKPKSTLQALQEQASAMMKACSTSSFSTTAVANASGLTFEQEMALLERKERLAEKELEVFRAQQALRQG